MPRRIDGVGVASGEDDDNAPADGGGSRDAGGSRGAERLQGREHLAAAAIHTELEEELCLHLGGD